MGPPGHTNSLGVWAPWRSVGGLHVTKCHPWWLNHRSPKFEEGEPRQNNHHQNAAIKFVTCEVMRPVRNKTSKKKRCPYKHPGSWHGQTQRCSYNEFTVSRELILHTFAYNLMWMHWYIRYCNVGQKYWNMNNNKRHIYIYIYVFIYAQFHPKRCLACCPVCHSLKCRGKTGNHRIIPYSCLQVHSQWQISHAHAVICFNSCEIQGQFDI